MLKRLRLILRLLLSSLQVLLEEVEERVFRARDERKRDEDNEGDNFFDR